MEQTENLAFNKNCYNIWRYQDKYAEVIKPEFQLSLGEGWTQEVNLNLLARELGYENLWIKRDDLSPTGSHKARSLAYQVSKYYQKGEENLLISSSGNAAIAGAAYSKLCNIIFFAFISPVTSQIKIELLEKIGANIIVTSHPINLANYVSRIFNITNLRPSINDTSLEGYKSIAYELAEKKVFPDAIFLCPTSASTLVGIGRAYKYLEENYKIKSPQIHAVQYGDITSLVDQTADNSATTYEVGDLNRLGVKHTQRDKEAIELIKTSNGNGWIVTQDEITKASKLLSNYSIFTSIEGTATLAGLIKASKLRNFKNPLCLFTGHYSQWENSPKPEKKSIYKIETYLEAKALFEKVL